ncbi:TRIC cation channel family protein [Corynebacterium sp. L4756]|uniref:trimeric intracellular cation channel family protein n=1 Tax=unclassified Corynebacterium TaxID=2624378 RepID=UPI00374D5E03
MKRMQEVDPLIDLLYRWSDVSGVLLMGIIGGTIARQRGYDIIGFFYIALFSSLGGGMIRDVLINRGTVAAMSQPEYLILAFSGALIARFVYFKGKTWEILQAHGDAIVSGLWAGTGTVKALTFGLPVVPCIMMGVFTATGGSMIRDVVTGRVPGVFGDNQPTVIPAIAASVIVLTADSFGYLAVGMILGPLVSIFLSLLGYWGGWRLRSNPEWAPVNDSAAQVAELAKKAEDKSRAVGRKYEPTRIRSWRHRQMEKALQRRIELEVKRGKRRSAAETAAEEFLETFTSEFDGVEPGQSDDQIENRSSQPAPMLQESERKAPEPSPGLADRVRATTAKGEAGDSEDSREEKESSTGFFADMGMDFSGEAYEDYDEETNTDRSDKDAERKDDAHGEMLDMILSDDKLTDELVNRLIEKYKERED